MLELVAIVHLMLVCPYYIGGFRLMLSDVDIAIFAAQLPAVGVVGLLVDLIAMRSLEGLAAGSSVSSVNSTTASLGGRQSGAGQSSRFGARRVFVGLSVVMVVCRHAGVICGELQRQRKSGRRGGVLVSREDVRGAR